jgi:hypothetical protein
VDRNSAALSSSSGVGHKSAWSVCEPGEFMLGQMVMSGVLGQGTQTFEVKRERRWADRVSGGTGKVGRGGGEGTSLDKQTDVFAISGKRRLAERSSAGRVMDPGVGVGARSGMISGREKVEKSVGVSAIQKMLGEGRGRRFSM